MAGTLRKYKNGWQGQVYIGVNALTGREIRKAKHFAHPHTRQGRTDARKAFDAWAQTLNHVELLGGGGKPITVNDMLDQWIAANTPRWTAKTLDDNTSKATWWVRPHIGHMLISEVTGHQLDMMYVHLQERGGRKSKNYPKGKPLSGTTALSAHTMLVSAFRQAVKWKHITASPTDDATAPKKNRSKIVPPTEKQVAALVEHATKTPMNAALFWMALSTGARRSQLLGIKWEDIDFDTTMVTFRRAVVSVNGLMVVKDSTKNERDYRVSLDSDLVDDLRKLKAWQAAIALQAGVPMVDAPFVFAAVPGAGAPWHPDAVGTWWGRVRRRANVGSVRFHDMRHYCATTLLSNGEDLRTVAGRLGHADPAVTLRVYAHFLPEKDREAASKMQGILGEFRSA